MKKGKRIIAIMLCLIMAIGNLSFAFAEDIMLISAKASDYEGHWAQTTIQKWIDEEKIVGFPDGSFKPNSNITRAQFVKMVNEIIDYDVKGEITFEDVKSNDWYFDSISLAQNIGYITGYSDKKFGPNDNISREQAAAILSRIQYLGDNESGVDSFIDKDKMSTWAKGLVGSASSVGFIKGYEDNTFRPLNKLTRAEALTMLDNVLVNSKNKVIYKMGTELNNTIINGDLIIAKTVGEGDVHLNNVEVLGSIYVYGGGNNSLYFNNVKVAKIIVDKDKVRLVLDDGSVVEEISVDDETILENKDGTVAKINVTSDNKVTLSGNFDSITVVGKSDIVLKDAKIKNLVVEEPIKILGTGTVELLTANKDGITYDKTTKITKTEIGKDVTKKPEEIKEETKPEPQKPSPASYRVRVTVDGIGAPFNTQVYSRTDKISDFLITEMQLIIAGSRNTEIEEYLVKVVSKLKNVEIGLTPVYTEEGFYKVISYLEGTSIYTDLRNMEAALVRDGNISIDDVTAVLNLYKSENVATDSNIIKEKLNDYPFESQTVSYNGEVVDTPFTITHKTETLTTNKQIAEFILNNIAFSTKTVDEFFTVFGDVITIKSTMGSKTSTIKIEKIKL